MDAFIRNWEPEVGHRGAHFQYVGSRLLAGCGLAVLPAAFGLAAAIDGRGGPVVEVLGALLFALDGASFAVGTIYLRRGWREMSETLGFKVSWRNAPTFRRPNFDDWKRRQKT